MLLKSNLVTALFAQLESLGITTRDKFSIKSTEGIVYIKAVKDDVTIEKRLRFDEDVNDFVAFDPQSLSVEEKRELVRRIYAHRSLSQAEIAVLLDIAQGSLSNYLRSQ